VKGLSKVCGALTVGVAAFSVTSGPVTAGAAPVTKTAVVLFPWQADGRPASQVHVTSHVAGYCWTGAMEMDDRYAWRCQAHNYIYDPCFAPEGRRVAEVLCNTASPWDGEGALAMSLTKPLPFGYANTAPDWTGFALQLSNKGRCVLRDFDHSPPVSGGPATYVCASDHFADLSTNSQPWVAYYWGTSEFGGPGSANTPHEEAVTVAYDGPD
jgi:hypothetical protein